LKGSKKKYVMGIKSKKENQELMSRIRIAGETSVDKEKITKGILSVISGRLMTIKQEIRNIDADLELYRKKYCLTDDDFLQQFSDGNLGDEEDYFIWQGSLEVKKRLIEEEELLREAF